MAILELKGLSKLFGHNMAVNDLDMEVAEGQIYGLIGPNGSGKTTVFNLVSGFLRPSRGKVIWQGRDITNMPTYRITKLGLVRTFQLTALFKEMTALQNVVMSCHLHTGVNLARADGHSECGPRKGRRLAPGLCRCIGDSECSGNRTQDYIA